MFKFIDENKREVEIYKRYSKALEDFLYKYKNSFNSIILCGSFATNSINSNSDIDIVVIIDTDSKSSETFKEEIFNNIKVQQFYFTEMELLDSFSYEKTILNRQRASLLASGRILKGNFINLGTLIDEAIKTLNYTIPIYKIEDAKSMINFIQNQIPTELDLLYKESIYGFMRTLNGLMDKYFIMIHQINNCLIPREKNIDENLSSIKDIELGELYCKVLIEENRLIQKENFYNLSKLIVKRLESYIEKNITNI